MKYFKTTLILFSLVFNYSYSFGQSFSLTDLIKMSKMNVDDFDTYVTAKGYAFHEEIDETNRQGVGYAYNLDSYTLKATKFIELYQRHYNNRYFIYYQTLDKKEYLNIKNQIKALGFTLKDTSVFKSDNGKVSNNFVYRKGKAEIDIYARYNSFEINYGVDF